MEATIAYDSTEYIEDVISEVYTTLSETLLIVVAVIFLFLGSLRAVFVPVIAIPISLIGGFLLMQLLGCASTCSRSWRSYSRWAGGRRCDRGGGKCERHLTEGSMSKRP